MQEKKREAPRRREQNNVSGVVETGEKSDDKVWRPESKLKLKMYIQYSNRVLRSITVTKKAYYNSCERDVAIAGDSRVVTNSSSQDNIANEESNK